MIKYILILILLVSNLLSIESLTPNKIFKSSGTVQDIKYFQNRLYAGTSNGTIEIFDAKTEEKIKEIKLPNIKDFMGDEIPAKIYSIDLFEDKILIVSQGMKGYRNIFLFEDEKLKKIIGIEKKYFVQKANFISNEEIIFGLLSNQIGVYNFKNNKLEYLLQISASSFADFALSEDKKILVSTDESGVVRTLLTNSGQVIGDLKTKNLDKVYQLDFKNNVILTAGQDRQGVVYDGLISYSMNFDFLLYSCGLSPNAKLGAIAYNEQNEVLVFDIKTKNRIYNLTGQKATLTQILFINEDEVFVSSDDENINYFNLKQGD